MRRALAFGLVTVTWSEDVDEILAGDLAAALAYLTPAKGVLISPMAPLGMRNRDRGTITLTSSLGLWRKLARVRRSPEVAVVYHARDHALTDRAGFVLAQGRGEVEEKPDREWLESITPDWDRFLEPKRGGLTGRALRTYYWERVRITVEIERIVAYPTTEAERRTGRQRQPARRPGATASRAEERHRASGGQRQGGEGHRSAPSHPARLVRRRRPAGGRPGDRRRGERRRAAPGGAAGIGRHRADAARGSRRTSSGRGWSGRSSACTRAGSQLTAAPWATRLTPARATGMPPSTLAYNLGAASLALPHARGPQGGTGRLAAGPPPRDQGRSAADRGGRERRADDGEAAAQLLEAHHPPAFGAGDRAAAEHRG